MLHRPPPASRSRVYPWSRAAAGTPASPGRSTRTGAGVRPASEAGVNDVSAMPSGSRTSARTIASSGRPRRRSSASTSTSNVVDAYRNADPGAVSWGNASARRRSSSRSPPSSSSRSMSTSPNPLVWVRTCHAENGWTPPDASSGSDPASGLVRSMRPASTSRRMAVATIGLVTEARRQTASTPIRGPSTGPNDSSRITPFASATPSVTNGTVPSATCDAASSNASPSARRRRRLDRSVDIRATIPLANLGAGSRGKKSASGRVQVSRAEYDPQDDRRRPSL